MLQYLHPSPNGNTNERRYLNAVNASPVIVSVVDRNERRDSAHCSYSRAVRHCVFRLETFNQIAEVFPIEIANGENIPGYYFSHKPQFFCAAAHSLTHWRDLTVKRCFARTKALCVSKVI